MRNLFKEFQTLLGNQPLQVATVLAVDGSSSIVSLPGLSGSMRVRGVAGIGTKVYVRNGFIEAAAPDLTVEIIEV